MNRGTIILAVAVLTAFAVVDRWKVYVIQVHNGESSYIVKYDRWLGHTYKCEEEDDSPCRRID